MDQDYFERRLDDVVRLAAFKANQLAGKYGFASDEREDIQQTLVLECLRRCGHFNSQRGNTATFTRIVIKHAVATLIGAQKSHRRDYRRCQRSLNSPAQRTDPSSPEVAEVISDEDYHFRMGRTARPFHQAVHLRHDVRRAVEALPPELRQICRLTIALDTMTLIAEAAGISRATLYRRMRSIREAFIRAGLSQYIARFSR